MSMRTSIIYGFGFHSDCEPAKFVEFLKKHKESFCETPEENKIFSELMEKTNNGTEMPDIDDIIINLFDHYSCRLSCNEGYGAAISNVMSRETDIRFSYRSPDDSCDTYAAVIFEETFPWNLNEKEKALTNEEITNICEKYAEELGIIEEPDYLAQEYYG